MQNLKRSFKKIYPNFLPYLIFTILYTNQHIVTRFRSFLENNKEGIIRINLKLKLYNCH